MALNKPSNGGDFADRNPFVKYNSQDGTLLQVDRSQNRDGVWETREVDVTDEAQFVMDLANIKTGWIFFGPQGPVKVLAPIDQGLPPRPEDKNEQGAPAYKFGFEVMLVWPKDLGGGLRELSSNAKVAVTAFDELHDRYLAAPESKAGKLPIVKIAGTTKVKTSMGSSYHAPNFEIVGWIARPAILDAPLKQAEQVAHAAPWEAARTPPFTGDRRAKPPAPPSPPPSALDPDDFG